MAQEVLFTQSYRQHLLNYPTADGTNGQYLQTNGSGTLSFSTVPISGSTFTLGSWTISVVSNELVFNYGGTVWLK